MTTTFKSNLGPFRTEIGERIFKERYQHDGCETWWDLAKTLAEDVFFRALKDHADHDKLHGPTKKIEKLIAEMKFIPGGRYLYYAGRPFKGFNNCFILLPEEDSREDWAKLSWKAESCLMTGGGIGVDYSLYRPSGSLLSRTGGFASGPIPKMFMINEIGRNVMQGGSRRSAIYASLNWQHGDIDWFLRVKDWHSMKVPGTDVTFAQAKEADFNFPCPLDMTNISVNFDTKWLKTYLTTGDVGSVFLRVMEGAMRHGEPGFSFNFFDKEDETGRNACTEVTSRFDSDVCNLGSLNMANIDTIEEFEEAIFFAIGFLYAGTFVAHLPYEKVKLVREKTRRIGLGLMGVHEWLLKRGYKYEMNPELSSWLSCYERVATDAAKYWQEEFSKLMGRDNLVVPIATRAIAPTGTIGMVAGTTTGIEPIYAVAYKRRYLVGGTKYRYQYVVDPTADYLIREFGVDPDSIETSIDLAKDPERRVKFQFDVQRYVDQGISSTLNLPPWGSKWNNEDRIDEMAQIVAKYAHGLRGITFYPDGARGGQPIVPIRYEDAVDKLGEEFEEHFEYTDVCDLKGGGTCGS